MSLSLVHISYWVLWGFHVEKLNEVVAGKRVVDTASDVPLVGVQSYQRPLIKYEFQHRMFMRSARRQQPVPDNAPQDNLFWPAAEHMSKT
jgi:hypothetical protein